MSAHTHTWPRRAAYFWQEAPFLRLVLPLALGIFCYDRWPGASSGAVGFWILAGVIATFAMLSFLRTRHAAVAAGRTLTLHIALFLLGHTLASSNDIRNHRQWVGKSLGDAQAHLVRLEEPQQKTRIWRVPVQFVSRLDSGRLKPSLGGAFLNFYKTNDPLPFGEGDTLFVSAAAWAPVENSGNPHSFDYARFLQRKGTHAQQFLGADDAVLVGKGATSQKDWIEQLHDHSIASLRRYVKDAQALGILEAMLLGYETDFDPELRQAYAETGVIHIVAISGGHVAMLFAVVNGVLFFLRRRWGRVFRMLLGIALMWVYVLVAGAPPSAVRSAVMFSVIALAFLARREGSALNTLCAAAFALLCYDPMWLFAVGFQLSFAAVLSLIIFYPPISRWVWSRWWVVNMVWKVVAASFAAQILTAPISVYYFHNFPLWFLVANVFAWVMLGACALVGGLSILAFSWAPSIASAVAMLVTWLVKAFNGIVRLLQKGNPASWSHLRISFVEMLCLYGVIAFTAIFLMQRRRLALHGSLASLCLLLTLLSIDRYKDLKQDRLVVYNTSRHTFIDRMVGTGYQPVFADTVWKAADPAPKDARIGYGAWRPSNLTNNGDVKRINGKTILLLDDALQFDSASPFPVDVLIINRPLKGLLASSIHRQFSPGRIVLGGSHRRWQTLAWKDSCTALRQRFQAIGLDGGLVIE